MSCAGGHRPPLQSGFPGHSAARFLNGLLAIVAQAAQPAVSRVANARTSKSSGTLVGKDDVRRLAVGETAATAVCATRTTGAGSGLFGGWLGLAPRRKHHPA